MVSTTDDAENISNLSVCTRYNYGTCFIFLSKFLIRKMLKFRGRYFLNSREFGIRFTKFIFGFPDELNEHATLFPSTWFSWRLATNFCGFFQHTRIWLRVTLNTNINVCDSSYVLPHWNVDLSPTFNFTLVLEK